MALVAEGMSAGPVRGASRHELLRVVGLAFGIAVTVGGTIGAGILRTPGSIAELTPHAGLVLGLWLLGGLHALAGAAVVAELATALPATGGLYVYSRRAFGEIGGLVVGWSDWLSYVAGAAALSIASAEFAALLLPRLAGWTVPLAMAAQLAFLALNWRGMRSGSWLQNITSALKAVLLMGFVLAAFALLPEQPERAVSAAPAAVTLVGVLAAYQLIVGAYSGWPAPAYFAEEDTRPARNIPRSLFIGVALVTAIYVLVNAAVQHVLPPAALAGRELPAGDAMRVLFGPAGSAVLAVVALVTVLSCLNANLLLGSRVLFGLSRDGLFFRAGSRVNRGGTPSTALMIGGVLSLLLTLTGAFETAFAMVAFFSVVPYAMTDAALFVLRRREPNLERPFRTPLYPWLPLLVLLVDTAVVVAFFVADVRGSLLSAGLVALAIPVLLVLRRARRLGPAAGA